DDRDRVGDEVVGLEGPEAATEGEDLVGRQLVIDGDAFEPHVDELIEDAGVPDPPGDGAAERPADEVLLAGDPADVASGVPGPAAVDVLLVVAGPLVREGLAR